MTSVSARCAQISSLHAGGLPIVVTFHALGLVRRVEGAWRALLVTLDLEIGDHALHAVYEGDDRHAPSRSAVVQQLVVRK